MPLKKRIITPIGGLVIEIKKTTPQEVDFTSLEKALPLDELLNLPLDNRIVSIDTGSKETEKVATPLSVTRRLRQNRRDEYAAITAKENTRKEASEIREQSYTAYLTQMSRFCNRVKGKYSAGMNKYNKLIDLYERVLQSHINSAGSKVHKKKRDTNKNKKQ